MYAVCPKCHNGTAYVKGDKLYCPDGHVFKLIEIMEVKKR